MVKKSMTEAEAIEVIRKVMHHFARAIQRLEKAEGGVTLAGLTSECRESAEKYEEAVAACRLAINALKEIQEYRAIGSVEDLKNLYYLRKRYEDETYDYCGEYGTEECGAKAQLERLKVYEEIGTVEAIAKVVRFFSVDADHHTITEKLDMLAEYKKIGTVEEVKEILQLISEGQEDVDESGISTGLLHTLLEYGQYKKIGTVKECQGAVEKQKAKKVGVWGDGVGDDGEILYDMYTCPNCEKDYENDYHDYEYCPECGQRMDRSET